MVADCPVWGWTAAVSFAEVLFSALQVWCSLNAEAAQVVLWRLGGLVVASCSSGVLFACLGLLWPVLGYLPYFPMMSMMGSAIS